MSTKENKDVVRRWNSPEEIWPTELLDESYANHSGTTPPWATIIQGLDEAKARFDQTRRENPTFRSIVEDIVAEGDMVAVRLTWYMGEKPYGNAMVFYRLKVTCLTKFFECIESVIRCNAKCQQELLT